jgi:hypothetical protein
MSNEWHGPRYWEGRWRDEAKENERLCTRIEALEADRRAWANQINKNTALMDAARDRIEALESALREIMNAHAYIPPRVVKIVHAALAGEQDKSAERDQTP